MRGDFCVMDGDNKLVEDNALQSIVEDLKIQEVIATAITWDRLFGGAAILMLVDDGSEELTEPLQIEKVNTIEELKVFEPGDINIMKCCEDSKDKRYNMPEIYTLINDYGFSFDVHYSRLIVFNGDVIPNDERMARNGWGGTVLEKIRMDIANYGVTLRNSLMALERMSQGVLKLEGMTSILSMPEGDDMIRKRMNLIDMARSIDNTIVVDNEDSYELHNLSLSNVDKIIEEYQTALAAVSSIPVTVLFGRSPGGLQSTGQSDLENFYNMIDRIRHGKYKPALQILLEVINNARDLHVVLPDNYTIEFKPLWSPSEKEQAETNKLNAESNKIKADTANIYCSSGAIDSQEIRATLANKELYTLDKTFDIEDNIEGE